jgi:hypothetical protein
MAFVRAEEPAAERTLGYRFGYWCGSASKIFGSRSCLVIGNFAIWALCVEFGVDPQRRLWLMLGFVSGWFFVRGFMSAALAGKGKK